MKAKFHTNQHFGARFTCYKGKFSHLAKDFEDTTKNFPDLRLHIDSTLNDGTNKFHLLDKDDYILASGIADFSNLGLNDKDAVKKLCEIFDILKIKHFTDNFIKKQIKALYDDRDIMVKQMMQDKRVTRNGSFDEIITK